MARGTWRAAWRAGCLLSSVVAIEGAAAESDAPAITRAGDTIELRAGLLTRRLDVANGRIATTQLRVDGTDLLAGPSAEFRVTFQRAVPNRRPGGLRRDAALPAAGPGAWVTDSPVEWKDPITIDGGKLAAAFRLVRLAVTNPRPGVRQLHLRVRSGSENPLPGVFLDLRYEIYDGFPVIRKWIEITNNGPYWLKIDQLVIDDIELAAEFRSATALTPAERGTESSIVAFGQADRSRGLIAASEIPSAPRRIAPTGAMGYADEHFEWVLGPSENFVSEPVFHFAYSGAVEQTLSGVSTPLDRAVERPFQRFLEQVVGLRGNAAAVPAPIWCSYTNFLTDINDRTMREQADIAARCGFVTFQLDEGWAGTPSPGGTEPDPARFPDFEATSRYITAQGLKLGLWVSCIRGPEAKDLVALPEAPSAPAVINTKRGSGMSFASAWRDYFGNDLVYLRDRFGATYVKEDLTNLSKGDFAAGHESRTPKESLLRGLRGLLRANDRLAELAPDMWIQITHEIYWRTPGPPADLAVLKHASAFHTSPNTYFGAGIGSKRVSPDWTFDPQKLRADLLLGCWTARQRFFGHRGLPLWAVEFYAANAVNFKGSLTPAVQDRQVCSWLMGAPTVFAGDLSSLTPENIAHYRQRFDLIKRLARTYDLYRYFEYSGVPEPTDTGWHWWGKLDDEGCGAVVVMRGSAGEDGRRINVPWTRAERTYRVTALLSGRALGEFSGAQLRAGTLELALPAYGQEILELAPAGNFTATSATSSP